MKKNILLAMVLCVSFLMHPFQTKAANITNMPPTSSAYDDSLEAKTLTNRLNEIYTMDRTNLNSSEKKGLRVEVKTIKHRLKVMSGGIYLSVGAIIIIILLLILIF
ncbi:hypothetical protein [Parasediminibacterium sp. JCM 36343]|uniref:hypothetical protein n=1 Tax=Parasediminibacterium sp. JCM 36343 TaxID=3374279 RepID=UPI0039787EA4